MKRLILTNGTYTASQVEALRSRGNDGDFGICLNRQLIWGPFPSDAELSGFFGVRKKGQRRHWLDDQARWRLDKIDATDIALVDFCARCDAVELWIDPHPNDQLQLICLLTYLRPHREIASKLVLIQTPASIGSQDREIQAKWKAVKISSDQFELAERAWRAFVAATPQDWFGLLATDLSALPRLRHAVMALLEELPWRATGLGATEMRVLEFVSGDEDVTPSAIFDHELNDSRRIFGYWELGALLDGLARCQKPAVSGIKDGPFTLESFDADLYRLYLESKLALTSLGYAILNQADDFTRHNPMRRWWGSTADQLWRWDPDNKVLVAPQ